ncbi:MAG: rhamnulose-1-phosphate aldolase, partial [Prevotella sp.]
MESILQGNAGLQREIEKVAEVAGYLWQNGWAERNGGNITVNITQWADDAMQRLPPISDIKPIGTTLPSLRGCYFFCKGTGKR